MKLGTRTPYVLSVILAAACGKGDVARDGGGTVSDGGGTASDGGTTPCTADISSDVHNCGLCSHDCLGASCTAGLCAPTVVATVPPSTNLYGPGGSPLVGCAYAVAVDSTHVYFIEDVADSTHYGVMRAALPTGTAEAVAVDTHFANGGGEVAFDQMTSLRIASGGVYFTAQNGDQGGVYVENTSLQYFGDTGHATGLFADDANVFWTQTAPSYAIWSGGSAPGNAPINLSTRPGQPTAIIADATSLYWIESTASASSIMQMPRGGGTAIAVATDDTNPVALAIDDDGVYWSSISTGPTQMRGHIMKWPKSGGAPVELATGFSSVTDLAVTSGVVYFADSYEVDASNNSVPNSGTIRRVATSGGPVVVLARQATSPWRIAVDSERVYWSSLNSLYGWPGFCNTQLGTSGPVSDIRSVAR